MLGICLDSAICLEKDSNERQPRPGVEMVYPEDDEQLITASPPAPSETESPPLKKKKGRPPKTSPKPIKQNIISRYPKRIKLSNKK